MWLRWMRPSLRGLRKEGALLEGILLVAASEESAADVLNSIEDAGMGELANRHSMLIEMRSGNLSDWNTCASQEGDDSLSGALRVSARRNVLSCPTDL